MPSFKTGPAITVALRKSGIAINKEIVKGLATGKRTGRVYVVRGMRYTASSVGEYPAKRTGVLIQSQSYRVTNKTLYFGNSATYAAYLENGTSRMGARTFLKPLVENNIDHVEKNLKTELKKAATR